MKKTFIHALLVIFTLSACATDPYTGESKVSKTAWGTGIGTLAGTGIGALVGGEKGALIGAGVGAATGAGTGAYIDVQARKLRQELFGTGVQVKQANGQIYLIMPGNITFDTNKNVIKSSFMPTLNSISKVLQEYNKTKVIVSGYTDSTGNDTINIPLSQKRAQAVAHYLNLHGVSLSRIHAFGYGAANPIASNATPEGREQNRRVEITIAQ